MLIFPYGKKMIDEMPAAAAYAAIGAEVSPVDVRATTCTGLPLAPLICAAALAGLEPRQDATARRREPAFRLRSAFSRPLCRELP